MAMDAPSPDGQNLGLAAYFPLDIEVRPGDTVIFENRSTDVPHTVTFGVPPFDPAGPALLTTDGRPNPVVFEPCFAPTLPTAGTEACPAPPSASPPPYDGTGFWNSGVVPPGGRVTLQIAPPAAPAAPADPEAAPETEAAGEAEADPPAKPDATPTYLFGCLLHHYMGGHLEVVEQDADRRTPAEVAERAEENRASIMAVAQRQAESPPAAGDGVTVAAGWGTKVVAVNQFAPAVTRVKAGQAVTWKALSPYEPHTVTFQSPFQAPDEPGVFVPGGVPSGGRYTSGLAHSGLLGPTPFPADSYSLVFTKPGTYSYVCVLHPGMAGEVVVTG
jgi:plastocyanin